jgi:quercetin dioxygenase-like cupin family protein
MKRLVPVILFCCSLHSGLAMAESLAPAPLVPASFRWLSPPNNPALQSAWVVGNEQKHGVYILRVKLAAGGRIPPHTHPDERNSTVLSGTIHVGFGETFDESNLVAIPTGAVFVTPANVSHYVWARDGEAIYQESGVGPTGTSFINR